MNDIVDKTIEMNIKDLIGFQINPKGYFTRMDIIIKKMALEEILGKNKIGLDFYRKMYSKLCAASNKKIEGRIANLKSLSNKIEKKTFNSKKHPILLTPKNNIWDGSHRIVCAYYYGHSAIWIRGIKREFKKENDFGMNRFKNKFDESELKIILENQNEMFERLKIGKGS